MAQLRFPSGIDSEEFLLRYWQKRPLYLPGALPAFDCALEPDELAGLACADEIESRLVLQSTGDPPWQVRYGPFEPGDFKHLPDTHWTLLVQDVDKYESGVASLLDYFRFIPDWRVDDVMVSYAVEGGSVGPHNDDYDVFLYQARGKRRWQIHSQPVGDDDCIPGLDLRILSRFEAEEEWVLGRGDMLYLPPGVAHWGTALDNDCVTCSVGFRAPAWRDLAHAWCDHLATTEVPKTRYADPNLGPQDASAELSEEVAEQIRRRLEGYLNPGGDRFQRWLGRFLTETKEQLQVEQTDVPLPPSAILKRFERERVLRRHPFARFAFIRGSGERDYLFANGEEYALAGHHGAFLRAITQPRELQFEYVFAHLRDQRRREFLCRLINDGYFQFVEG